MLHVPRSLGALAVAVCDLERAINSTTFSSGITSPASVIATPRHNLTPFKKSPNGLLIASPANPTGGVTPREEIDKLVAGLMEHPQVALLSDEIYSQMLYHGQEHVSLLQYPEIRDRLILLDGWSKTYAMTGWRLGWMVVPPASRLAMTAALPPTAPSMPLTTVLMQIAESANSR